jgi:glycerate dehydrogenase
LLPELDVLSLHCPLTDATRRLVSRERLARMKPDAVLINTARGALVDTAALAVALKSGRLGGAGIDVLEREPPPHDHPLLDPAIPNLIVTPQRRLARARGAPALPRRARAETWNPSSTASRRNRRRQN